MVSDGTDLFVATTYQYGNQGVYRSTDNGINWSEVNTGLVGSEYIDSISIHASAAGELYVSLNKYTLGNPSISYIYQTSNSGGNWSELDQPPVQSNSFVKNGSNIVSGMVNKGIYRSSDSGSSWTYSNTGLTAVEVNGLFTTSGGKLLVGTGDLDLAVSADNGATWSTENLLSAGLGFLSVYDFVEDSSGNLYASTVGVLLTATNRGVMFKSTDGGTSWSESNSGLAHNMTGYALEIASDDTLYLGTPVGVQKSVDAAANWTQTTRFSDALTAHSDLVVMANGDIWATYTALNLSSDGGSTWNSVDTGSFINSDIFQDNSGALYAFGITLRISTDGGSSWGSGISALPSGGTATAFLDDGNGKLYLGVSGATTSSESGVYVSTDSGATWTADNTGIMNREVTSLTLGADGFVYAGTNGGGLYRSDSSSGSGSSGGSGSGSGGGSGGSGGSGSGSGGGSSSGGSSSSGSSGSFNVALLMGLASLFCLRRRKILSA